MSSGGRGNGWVTAGLTVIIDNMPDDYPAKARYVALFREMMERIAGLQGADGFWHASLLDPASYPAPETSATGFFTYSLLWGVNRGPARPRALRPGCRKGVAGALRGRA